MAELDEIINEPSESQQRITKLSKDVKTTSDERDAARLEAETARAESAESKRVAEFSEGFVDVVAGNPAAKDFKDDIKAKVLSGYSLEDATFAVLGKAGKLNQPQVETNQAQFAGGSATTNLPVQGMEKSAAEMTQDERRNELMGRTDLADILAPRSQR